MDRDRKLRNLVLEALDWEPSIDATDIGVAVKDGIVTMSGRVETYAQKLAAAHVADKVRGVRALVLQIEVAPYAARPSDQEIASRAARMLEWDVEVPNGVGATVEHGWVTLHGDVDWPYQRNAAARGVARLDGISGIINDIHLRPRVQPADIRDRIRKAFNRDALLEAGNIDVEVEGTRVTLKGHVHEFRERRLAEDAAWEAPGVSYVEDQIVVT